MKTVIEMAQEIAAQYSKAERFQTWTHDFMMQRLMELVAASAADERKATLDEIAKWLEVEKDAPYWAELVRARSQA